jgi:hypothetical protein
VAFFHASISERLEDVACGGAVTRCNCLPRRHIKAGLVTNKKPFLLEISDESYDCGSCVSRVGICSTRKSGKEVDVALVLMWPL